MIVLSKKIKAASKYKGKSKFEFWLNIQDGDELLVSHEMKCLHKGRGQSYVPDILFVNMRTLENFVSTYQNAINYLEKLEYTVD